jgi:transmembrane sensor
VSDHAVLKKAAEWFAILRSGDAGEREQREWQAWLVASPRHQAAWRRIEAVEQRFGQAPEAGARAALATGKWQRRRAVRTLAWLAVGGAAAAAGVIGNEGSRDYLASLDAAYRTGTGETRRLALADGGALWLNTATAVDIDYTDDLRRIRLYRGEILLQTAPDQQAHPRPLVVDVPQGRLRALGTRFNVDLSEADPRLAVFQGAVRVEANHAAAVVVPAGRQLRFTASHTDALEGADESRAAWSENRLVADNMRLDAFLARLSRYRRGHLGCAPAVAHLRLTGSYPLADTERILSALAATLPVKVVHVLPWWTTVEAA